MPPLPRGVCSVCGAAVALRVNGSVREHSVMDEQLRQPGRSVCAGSGGPPVEATSARSSS